MIVIGGGSPGEHAAGGAGRGRPAGRGRRARAGRRRVLLLRVHPVQDAAAARRGGAGGARGGRRPPRSTSRPRWPGATSWSPTTPTPARSSWLADNGIDLLRGSGRLAGRRRGRGRRQALHGRARRAGQRRRPDHPAGPVRASSTGIWTNREATGDEGRAAAAARARRRPGRDRAGAGRRAASAARSCWSSAPRACSPARPRRSARRSARSCAATASSSSSASGAAAARRDGEDYVLTLDDGRELRGDQLLVATGRRPRVRRDRPGDGRHRRRTRAACRSTRSCAPASACGRSATSPACSRSRTSASTRAGSSPRTSSASRARRNYDAVPRVTYTDPQAAAVGATEDRVQRDRRSCADVAKTATYTRAYAESNGYLTLLSDGERLTGAHAFGPEAGEWLQQATLAIRARVPLDVLLDTIQPFPTFSEIYLGALKALDREVARVNGLAALDEAPTWLNSEPLTSAELRGRVVLVDFWTYSCVNWLRTLPYVRAWHERYRDARRRRRARARVRLRARARQRAPRDRRAGRRLPGRDRQRLQRSGGPSTTTTGPRSTCSTATGASASTHFGEEAYAETERAIQQLLGVDEALVRRRRRRRRRGRRLGHAEVPGDLPRRARAASGARDAARSRSTSGRSTASGRSARRPRVLEAAAGSIAYRFEGRDLNLVLAAPARRSTFTVRLDGEPPGDDHGLDVDAPAKARSTSRGCTSSSASADAVARAHLRDHLRRPGRARLRVHVRLISRPGRSRAARRARPWRWRRSARASRRAATASRRSRPWARSGSRCA